MKANSKIQEELNSLGINMSAGIPNLMEVPDGYFDQLENEVISQIKQNKFLESLPKSMPFEIQDNYFDEFETNISQMIHSEGFLNKLPKTNPYQSPNGYFEQFESNLSKKRIPTPKFSQNLKVSARKMISIAASILLFLSLGLYLMTQNPNVNLNQSDSSTVGLRNQLKLIPSTEINNYILEHQEEFSTDMALDLPNEADIDLNSLESEILDKQFINLSKEELSIYL